MGRGWNGEQMEWDMKDWKRKKKYEEMNVGME